MKNRLVIFKLWSRERRDLCGWIQQTVSLLSHSCLYDVYGKITVWFSTSERTLRWSTWAFYFLIINIVAGPAYRAVETRSTCWQNHLIRGNLDIYKIITLNYMLPFIFSLIYKSLNNYVYLFQVMCELESVLMELNNGVELEIVPREVMSREYRHFPQTGSRNLRDWFILRDFITNLEYLEQVCDYVIRVERAIQNQWAAADLGIDASAPVWVGFGYPPVTGAIASLLSRLQILEIKLIKQPSVFREAANNALIICGRCY